MSFAKASGKSKQMNDIFREVDEEYRHEQLLQFWHANAKLIILTLLLAIAAAGGAGFWKSHELNKKQQETYTLTHAVDDAAIQPPGNALTALNKGADSLSGQRVIPARFAIARATLNASDKAGAIGMYDQIAASQTATTAERNLADIQSIALQVQDGDPAQLTARLDKLAGDDNAYRFSARELQVLLAMRQGDMQKAHDIAAALAKDSKAPDGVHQRAQQLAAVTGEGLAPSSTPDNDVSVDLPEEK